MKLNDLKTKLNVLQEELRGYKEADEFTDEISARVDAIDAESKTLRSNIKRQELIEAANILEVERAEEIEVAEEREVVAAPVAFRDWLRKAVEGGDRTPFVLRDEPLSATNQTAVINKTVANSVDILTSPGEAFLRTIGATFYPGLNGQFVLPRMDQDTAGFVGETVPSTAGAGNAAADASMNFAGLTLSPRRVSHVQSITKEMLAQTNPAVYASVLQNLVNGVWNAVTTDYFSTLKTDAASRISDINVSHAAITYGDLVNMEASIGGLNIGQAVYVTDPKTKGYLKSTIALGTTAGAPMWVDNEVNGYSAYGHPNAGAEHVFFGDFSRQVVGQWGGLEIIVDPYTQAATGQIVLTIIGLFDTGCANPNAFCWTDDASLV